ncbi:thiamine phosphate synthase [Microbacterium sp. ARD31]|uniref:thiamine phosphate synthase n=1 Tax=Microbacterium sp. ARD31 TaxID=2962576 RepID=UPI0028814565|nr:thiamine phosphate synthase [Microbacterium sp. ARD31]MDT0187835.1 thiamine phosphate synthase [Microbacterium sp. ARD31]
MIPRLVVLTDRAQLRLGRGLVRTVRECADAGLSAVVVREHDLAPSARSALVEELVSVPGLTVISSRIPDPRAHGLHCAAQQGAPPSAGRWGRSCHSRAEADRAADEGASWVTLSPYAVSASKPGHGPALPPGAYAGHRVPVLALAGIDARNAAAARSAGAHGVAVMGAVMRAADPAAVVAGLLEALA